MAGDLDAGSGHADDLTICPDGAIKLVFHMKHSSRSLTALIVTTLALAGCASGSAIVTGTKRPPLEPDKVVLYLEPPAQFEVIGLVSASSGSGWTQQMSVDYALKELKAQAARLGANGLILSPTVGTESSVLGDMSVSAKTVQGKAIYVTSAQSEQ